jgi:hypothetical protein
MDMWMKLPALPVIRKKIRDRNKPISKKVALKLLL